MKKILLLIDENIYQIRGPIITNFTGGFFGICSKEEKAKVKAKLERNNKGLFKSERLNQIAEKNPILKSIDIFEEILDDVEKTIPAEYRENFYNNLETLQVTLIKPDVSPLEEEDAKKHTSTPALYNSYDNRMALLLKPILIRKQAIDQLVNEGKLKTPFHEHLKRVIIHELFHLSSSRYNLSNHTMYSGVSSLNDGKKQKFNSFNEAITEMLSRRTLPNEEIDINCAYNPLVSIIEQFVDLIGLDAVLKSYYTNDELESIRNELLKIINDKTKVDTLIETLCAHSPNDIFYSGKDPLTKTQTLLFEFYKRKIQQLHNQGKYPEASSLLRSLKKNVSAICNDPYYSEDILVNPEKKNNVQAYVKLAEYNEAEIIKAIKNTQRTRTRDKKKRNN